MKPETILDLPLDVLFEILILAHPMDVLQLARTTGRLRRLLLTRSISLTIWKAVFRNVVGLPNCPIDLSEPQYANLLYGTHCHICLEQDLQTVYWAARTRCCPQCFPSSFLSFGQLLVDPRTAGLPTHVYAWIPAVKQEAGRFGFLDTDYHFLPFVEKIKKQYDNIDGGSNSREDWFAQIKLTITQMQRDTRALEVWDAGQRSHNSQELSAARRRRGATILQKLTSLGWGPEIEAACLRKLYEHRLFRQPKDLTDQGWITIEPVLTKLMHDLKSERLQNMGKDIIWKRRKVAISLIKSFAAAQPLDAITPPTADILRSTPFRDAIEKNLMDAPFDPNSLKGAFLQLPELYCKWKRQRTEELVQIARDSLASEPSRRLDPGLLYFACDGSCVEPIKYPRILIHSCTTTLRVGMKPMDGLFTNLGEEAWNNGGHRVSFHNSAYQAARVVVSSCSMDPDIISTEELDRRDPLLECVSCRNSRGSLLMRWRRAILHLLQDHRSVSASSFKLLTTDEESSIRTAEKHADIAWIQEMSGLPIFWCTRCKSRGTVLSLLLHLKEFHHVERFAAKDIAPHPDSGYEKPCFRYKFVSCGGLN